MGRLNRNLRSQSNIPCYFWFLMPNNKVRPSISCSLWEKAELDKCWIWFGKAVSLWALFLPCLWLKKYIESTHTQFWKASHKCVHVEILKNSNAAIFGALYDSNKVLESHSWIYEMYLFNVSTWTVCLYNHLKYVFVSKCFLSWI